MPQLFELLPPSLALRVSLPRCQTKCVRRHKTAGAYGMQTYWVCVRWLLCRFLARYSRISGRVICIKFN